MLFGKKWLLVIEVRNCYGIDGPFIAGKHDDLAMILTEFSMATLGKPENVWIFDVR